MQTVLREIVMSARAPTGARHSVVTAVDSYGIRESCVTPRWLE